MAKKKSIPTAVRIATLKDLFDVATPENFNRLSKDLLLWMHVQVGLKAVGVKPLDVAMIWTDDDSNEITGVQFTTPKQ